MSTLVWQNQFIKEMSEMSDRELMFETMKIAQGDNADIYSDTGNRFTDRGEWKFNQLKKELNKRLPKSFKGFDSGEGFYE